MIARKPIALVAGVCLALAGCGGGGGDESSMSVVSVEATAHETESVEEISTALPPLEYETPPQYPEGIEANSPANATAFVQYVVEVVNYAQKFGDTEVLASISHPDCGFCNATIAQIESMVAAGQRVVGSEFECTGTAMGYRPETAAYFADTSCTFSAGSLHALNGDTLETYEASTQAISWMVGIGADGWALLNSAETNG